MGYITNEDDNGQVDELVSMIDRLIEQGQEEIHLHVDDLADGIKIKSSISNDCGTNKGACCQPTELMDEDEF